SVEDSTEKVEGPGARDATESVNDSRDEEPQPPDVAATLSGLLAGLPTLAGPQRLATSLRQKFVNNSAAAGNASIDEIRLVDISHDADQTQALKKENDRKFKFSHTTESLRKKISEEQ
ncbi:hypothetical protein TSAR_003182, partial [Trichomalopsis sarcophagae]